MAEIDNTQQPAGVQTPLKQNDPVQSPLGNQVGDPRPCPKDCTKCGFQQHAFCAAKMSFDAFAVMSQMLQRLDAQAKKIDELSARIAAIHSAEANLAAPQPVQTDLFAETK